MSDRKLTEKQEAFLKFLFDPDTANGDPREAAILAGYSSGDQWRMVTESLKKEILEYTESNLAAHAPKASMQMAEVLKGNVAGTAARDVLAASKEVLDRVGVIKKVPEDEKPMVSIPVILLPAKEATVVEDD